MKVLLYIRVKLPDGSSPFVKPIRSANTQLKPLYATVNGVKEHHPEGVYYLRYLKGKKRVWEPVGSDAPMALLIQRQRETGLTAQKAGVQIVEPVLTGRDLGSAIDEYLANVAVSKSAKTLVQYGYLLRVFRGLCTKPLEAITREDILNLRDYFIGRGNSPCTVEHHLTNLRTFLTNFERPWPLKKTDRLKPVKKEVTAYSQEEFGALLNAATEDEADLIWFLLGSGVRSGECKNGTWADIDFARGTFKVAARPGFKPKDSEEGTVTLPDELVDRLRARRARSTSVKIFSMVKENSEDELLNTIKRLAHEAGLNCGECHFKPSMSYPHGRCCSSGPFCRRFITHKFRTSFATWRSASGEPVDNIRRWLRHSNLATTQKYLAAADLQTPQVRSRVNSAYAMVGQRQATVAA